MYKRKLSQESKDSISDVYYEKEVGFKKPKINSNIENLDDVELFYESEVEENIENQLNKSNILGNESQNSACELSSINIENQSNEPNILGNESQKSDRKLSSINMDENLFYKDNLDEPSNESISKIDLKNGLDYVKMIAGINLIRNDDLLINLKDDKCNNSLTSKEPFRKKSPLFTAFETNNRESILNNFEIIISAVLDENSYLFSETEKEIISQFSNFNSEAKSLFLLLIFKKNKWVSVESLNVLSEAKRKTCLKLLINSGLLNGSNDFQTLDEALYVLDGNDAKKVAEIFKINGDKKTKSKAIDLILNDTKVANSLNNSLQKEEDRLNFLKGKLKNKIVKVNYEKSKIFFKILLLYFQPVAFDKDVYNHYLTLIINLNNLEFHDKFVERDFEALSDLYPEQKDLNDFVDACLTELSLHEKSIDKDNLLIYFKNNLLIEYENYVTSNFSNDIQLPDFLRRFKAGSRLVECIILITDELMNVNLYKESSIILKFLINQEFYCYDKIGNLFSNLIIILNDQLQEYGDALEYCNRALVSSNVKNGLKIRFGGNKLEIQSKLNNEQNFEVDLSVGIAKKHLNLSRQFVEQKIKNKELKKSVSDTNVVEEIASNYFLDESNYDENDTVFEECFKGQNQFFDLIFFNLFYDEIYAPIPQVFKYRFQKHPLDFDSESFIKNRKELIETKFKELKTIRTLKGLCNIILESRRHNKYLKSITKFNSINFENLKQVIYNIGREKLFEILDYLIKNYNSLYDSSPSFILLNDEKRKIKFCEVLEPNTYIYENKILWFKFLASPLLNFETEFFFIKTDDDFQDTNSTVLYEALRAIENHQDIENHQTIENNQAIQINESIECLKD